MGPKMQVFAVLAALVALALILSSLGGPPDTIDTGARERTPAPEAAAAAPQPPPPPAVTEPGFSVVSNEALAPGRGRRVVLDVASAEVTIAQCRLLHDRFRAQAQPGQIVVRKPNPASGNTSMNWCIENFDGGQPLILFGQP